MSRPCRVMIEQLQALVRGGWAGTIARSSRSRAARSAASSGARSRYQGRRLAGRVSRRSTATGPQLPRDRGFAQRRAGAEDGKTPRGGPSRNSPRLAAPGPDRFPLTSPRGRGPRVAGCAIKAGEAVSREQASAQARAPGPVERALPSWCCTRQAQVPSRRQSVQKWTDSSSSWGVSCVLSRSASTADVRSDDGHRHPAGILWPAVSEYPIYPPHCQHQGRHRLHMTAPRPVGPGTPSGRVLMASARQASAIFTEF